MTQGVQKFVNIKMHTCMLNTEVFENIYLQKLQ